jgi:hypothetical protein
MVYFWLFSKSFIKIIFNPSFICELMGFGWQVNHSQQDHQIIHWGTDGILLLLIIDI